MAPDTTQGQIAAKDASTSPNNASAAVDEAATNATATPPSSDGTEEVTLDELAAMCDQRATTYALLSRLYRIEVDDELLDELRDMLYPMDTGNDDVDRGYYEIAKFMSNTWENSVTDLAVDYAHTFIGNGEDAYSAAYPYESVYTSERRLLMQDARDEVLAIYRGYGLDKKDSWKDAEDHVSVELEFMQILSERTADALREGNEEKAENLLTAQKNFLADHLAAWTPMMVDDMKKFAQTRLYQGLAYLTDGFLETDLTFLEGALGDEDA